MVLFVEDYRILLGLKVKHMFTDLHTYNIISYTCVSAGHLVFNDLGQTARLQENWRHLKHEGLFVPSLWKEEEKEHFPHRVFGLTGRKSSPTIWNWGIAEKLSA